MSKQVGPSTERRLLRIIDLGERLVVMVFFAAFAFTVSHTLATNPFNLLLLMSDGFVVLFLLFRKSEAVVTLRPFDWIAGMLGTILPLLARPGGHHLVPPVVSAALMGLGVVLGFWSKLTLQRSFGIAAANRGVINTGPYRLIRHPMYAGYVLVHIGFTLSNPQLWNVMCYGLSFAFQIYRILAEERILSMDPAYGALKDKVRYRLVPGVSRMGRLMPLYLIAEREFRAYVATASFWIALVIGPLALGGLLLTANLGAPPPPSPVSVTGAQPALADEVFAALAQAAGLEGRRFVRRAGPDVPALSVQSDAVGITLRFGDGLVLSPSGRELVARTLERDEALRQLRQARATWPAVVVDAAGPPAARRVVAADRVARFSLVFLLWLTLTGSLGMLLQAVVRERSNRALETLLAAARPWEIVFGKLAGVGCVSLLVLVCWLGFGCLMAQAAPQAGGMVNSLLHLVARPALLAEAAGVYVLAFGFFGLITIAIGATAADSAAAQNQARPMFGLLVAVFFVAMASAANAGGPPAWLVLAPPLTPFLLILHPPSPGIALASIGLLLAATWAAGVWAVSALGLKPPVWGLSQVFGKYSSPRFAPNGL